MTKLQLLSGFLSERLTAVVKEILDVVEEAVSESREEAARCREEAARYRQENGSLRRQLRDVLLLEAGTQWLSKAATEFEKTDTDQNRSSSESFKSLSALLASLGSRDSLARRGLRRHCWCLGSSDDVTGDLLCFWSGSASAG